MITTANDWRPKFALRVAVGASFVFHIVFFATAMLASDAIARFLLVPPPPPDLRQNDEIVTISVARRIAPIARVAGAAGRPILRRPVRFAKPPQRVAALQRAFARMLQGSPGDVVQVSKDPAAAPKRYQLQLRGKLGHLHRGEGIYYPIRGWRAGSLDYYYVAYEYTYPDGRIESGNVPWPIHFAPDIDPFVSADPALLERTRLPAPPPGFVPPGDLGKALRAYFPAMQFED